MGKTVAYVATAILLGVVATLPVMLLTPERVDQGYYAFDEDTRLQLKADVEGLQNEGLQDLEEVGTATVPSTPIHIGLILVIGFVFASGVALYSKRKIL